MEVEPTNDVGIKTVRVEPISKEAFAPFGTLLAAEGDRHRIEMYGSVIDVFTAGKIDSDVPVEIFMSRSSVREFRVRFLERHMLLAQMFVPLCGTPFVAVAARPDAPEDKNGIPLLDEIRAFLVPGDKAVMIHRGTWHEPPFPLVDDSLRLTTTHAALTSGLESDLNERNEINVNDVEKRNVTERSGYELRLALP
jgi:ureidoglycolate lyase